MLGSFNAMEINLIKFKNTKLRRQSFIPNVDILHGISHVTHFDENSHHKVESALWISS